MRFLLQRQRVYIVRLQSGALAVFSPTALTPEVRSTVESMGNKVAYIAALDYEHHIFITEWAKAFPSAKLLGVEGLAEKREKTQATAGSKFQHVWTQKNKASMKIDHEFDQEFEHEYVGSHANKELVFLHKRDRTLIEAEYVLLVVSLTLNLYSWYTFSVHTLQLFSNSRSSQEHGTLTTGFGHSMMFNLPANEQFSRTGEDPTSGILTKIFIGLQNTMGPATWQKRFLWHIASAGDRQGFNQSARKIASWDFDRIIPCHGDVIETGGKGVFQKVFDWHLKDSIK